MQTRFWLSNQDLTEKEKQRDTLISSPSSSGRGGMVKEKPRCQAMHKGCTCLTMIQPYHQDACLSPCITVGINFGGKTSGYNRKKSGSGPRNQSAHM